MVAELEKRIQILKSEIEKNIEIKNQLIDEKAHLQQSFELSIQKIKDFESKYIIFIIMTHHYVT